jgi:hypothetical protein
MAIDPIPSVVAVLVVRADAHFELRLAPKTRSVRRTDLYVWIELSGREFTLVLAKDFDLRFVIAAVTQKIIGLNLKSDPFRIRHGIVLVKLKPVSTRADSKLLCGVTLRTVILCAGRNDQRAEHNDARNHSSFHETPPDGFHLQPAAEPISGSPSDSGISASIALESKKKFASWSTG